MDGIDLKIAIELSPFKVRFSRVGKEILEIVINLEACKANLFVGLPSLLAWNSCLRKAFRAQVLFGL